MVSWKICWNCRHRTYFIYLFIYLTSIINVIFNNFLWCILWHKERRYYGLQSSLDIAPVSFSDNFQIIIISQPNCWEMYCACYFYKKKLFLDLVLKGIESVQWNQHLLGCFVYTGQDQKGREIWEVPSRQVAKFCQEKRRWIKVVLLRWLNFEPGLVLARYALTVFMHQRLSRIYVHLLSVQICVRHACFLTTHFGLSLLT